MQISIYSSLQDCVNSMQYHSEIMEDPSSYVLVVILSHIVDRISKLNFNFNFLNPNEDIVLLYVFGNSHIPKYQNTKSYATSNSIMEKRKMEVQHQIR